MMIMMKHVNFIWSLWDPFSSSHWPSKTLGEGDGSHQLAATGRRWHLSPRSLRWFPRFPCHPWWQVPQKNTMGKHIHVYFTHNCHPYLECISVASLRLIRNREHEEICVWRIVSERDTLNPYCWWLTSGGFFSRSFSGGIEQTQDLKWESRPISTVCRWYCIGIGVP